MKNKIKKRLCAVRFFSITELIKTKKNSWNVMRVWLLIYSLLEKKGDHAKV